MRIDRHQPAISYLGSRAFRNESLEPTPKFGVTTKDMEQLRQRHLERGQQRAAEAAYAEAQALALAKLLSGG